MTIDVRFAFYGPSPMQHKGDPVYLKGVVSDGLDRTYFGNDLAVVMKNVKAAREQGQDYRVERSTYERIGGDLTCKVHTLAVWPPRYKKE